MAVIGSGGEVGEETSSILGLLLGLAITGGAPRGKTIKNFKVVTADQQAKYGLLVRGGPVYLHGSQTTKPAFPVDRASGSGASNLCFRKPSREVCCMVKFENLHVEVPSLPHPQIGQWAKVPLSQNGEETTDSGPNLSSG